MLKIVPFEELACPLDGLRLQRTDGALCCPAGHGFDISSQGYTHLLPVQQKRSRDPGDSKEMVAARRRFLNAGSYAPIADAVSAAVLTGFAPGSSFTCLDAGCGEGYYLRCLAASAGQAQQLALLGLDISKWAVQSAAKQDRRMQWVVGSNANLPVLPATLDRVLCMFGFPTYGEFARVMKPGGVLLQVDPGPDHLRELRETIYPSIKVRRPVEKVIPDGFSLLDIEPVRFVLPLEGAEQIADLLLMTPHLFRARPEGRARVATLSTLSLTVDIRLSRFLRCG